MPHSNGVELFSYLPNREVTDRAVSVSHFLERTRINVNSKRFIGGYLESFADRIATLADHLIHKGDSDRDFESNLQELDFLLKTVRTHKSVLPGLSVRCCAQEADLLQPDSPLSQYESRVAYGYEQLFATVFFSTHPADSDARTRISENIQVHPGWDLLVQYDSRYTNVNYFIRSQKFLIASPLGDLISDLTQLHHFDDDNQTIGLSLETINIGKDDATNARDIFDYLCQEIRALLSQPIFGVESIGDHPRLQQIMNEVKQLRKMVQKAVV